MPGLDRVVITAVTLFVVLSVGITAFSAFAEPTTGEGELRSGEPVLLDGPEQYSDVADSYGTDPTVYNSLGKAVSLSGSPDSYVQSDRDVELATDDTWTLSTWASVDASSTSNTMTVVSAGERVVLTYDGSAGNWSAWVYDPGSTESYLVNVSAPSPTGLTNLQVTMNESQVAIYRNNTAGDVKDRSAGSIASAPSGNDNLDGSLDETRGLDDHLNSSQRQQLIDTPVGPLNTANRTVRIMYDEADSRTQYIFYTDARLEQSNVSFVDGHPGEVLEGKNVINDITGSTDYVWENEGPQIYVTDGGQLDDAPVAYVDYTYHAYGGAVTDWTNSLERTISMAAMIPTILILITIISYLMLLRGR